MAHDPTYEARHGHDRRREFQLIQEVAVTWPAIVRPILRAWWKRQPIRFRFHLIARGNLELSKVQAELVLSREPNETLTLLETKEVKTL